MNRQLATNIDTDLVTAIAVLRPEHRPQLIPIMALNESFAVIRSPAMPEFGFLIREDAAPRYGWEEWLTLRGTDVHVRIASATLDPLDTVRVAQSIGTACRDAGIVTVFVHHANQHTLWSNGLTLPDVRATDLSDYPLVLLARYGMEVIADALSWIDFDAKWCTQYGSVRGPLRPRPLTIQDLRFLECHIAHLTSDLDTLRRFHRR